jgi:hypothetical protein
MLLITEESHTGMFVISGLHLDRHFSKINISSLEQSSREWRYMPVISPTQEGEAGRP